MQLAMIKYVRPSNCETTSKQEAHKQVSIIGLFNPNMSHVPQQVSIIGLFNLNMSHVPQWDRLTQEFEFY